MPTLRPLRLTRFRHDSNDKPGCRYFGCNAVCVAPGTAPKLAGLLNSPIMTMTYKPPGSRLSRLLYGLLAYTSLGIGIIAIFVPGLPTTEFILLAAWAATRSSPRLNAWLENHRVFGPMLYNWRNGRMVSRGSKISATVSMLACAILMLSLFTHVWWLYLAIAGMALGNLWLWSRPEPASKPPLTHDKR